MTVTEPIDLHHQAPGIIASYLLETEDGPAIFDCGPTSTILTARSPTHGC